MSTDQQNIPTEEAKEIGRRLAALRGPVRESIMLRDLDRVLRLDDQIVRAQQRQVGKLDIPDAEEEDMIIAGDVTIQNTLPKEETTTPTSAPAVSPELQQLLQTVGWIKKAIAVVALVSALTGGAGIGAVVMNWLKSDGDTVIQQTLDDIGWQLEIDGATPQ